MSTEECSSTCLVVIYNHNFERNIPIINRIYEGRFRHIYHIMPFYRGTDPSVIGVYENSFQFSGYIAQAYPKLANVNCSNFLFVADDMVINPDITEQNASQKLHLSSKTSFICRIGLVTNETVRSWTHALTSMIFFNATGNACEWRHFMPTIEEARKQFAKCGLDWRNGTTTRFSKWFGPWVLPMKTTPEDFFHIPGMPTLARISSFFRDKSEPTYPMAYGYSDLFAVSMDSLADFAHYCGILSAVRIHVEVAIPTALTLVSDRINTAQSLGLSYIDGVSDYAMRQKLEDEYGWSYKKLVAAIKPSQLLYHPVKLSKWKDIP